MEGAKKLHPNSLYGARGDIQQPALSAYERSNGHAGGGRRSPDLGPGGVGGMPLQQQQQPIAEINEAHHQHLMQGGDYQVSGIPEAEYGGMYLPPGAQYNHMGHIAVAPSQKYPHMMGDAGGYPHYQTYSHYGGNPYGAAPQYLSEASPQMAQYMGQEYVERARSPPSPSSRSASPSPGMMGGVRILPASPNPSGAPHHQLHAMPQTRYEDVDQLSRLVGSEHYCVAPSPRPSLADQYSGGGPVGVPPPSDGGVPPHQMHVYGYVAPQQNYPMPMSFKDSQNGLSLGSAGGQSMYGDEEELQKQMAGMTMEMLGVPGGVGVGVDAPRLQWRDPNLPEVIGFLESPSPVVKANAAAYLQHLCYMDDPNKQKTRNLGGIPPLVRLLSHESGEVCRNACGALRNLSYGRQNDENKRAIKQAGGISALTTLLSRTHDIEVKELVTGVIWNMSSCEDLKQCIIEEGAQVIVSQVIIPHSGWHAVNPGDTYWSTVFRNASGVLRNVSSAGAPARRRLRALPGLAEALLHVVKTALAQDSMSSKIVENCVCTLRNLSYRCQEVEDPAYDRRQLETTPQTQAVATRSTAPPTKGDSLGCFGGSKKKKEGQSGASSASTSPHGRGPGDVSDNVPHNNGRDDGPQQMAQQVPKGTETLWSPEVVPLYLALLQHCSNPETLEAAAGALQNLAACYWQPSIEIRAAVRKEKGLPILVELLRMEVDRVVCAIATALRNLAIDQRNKELIGKYAMRDLVQKLPSGVPQHDQGTSDDTIAAVLATLNEVIKRNAEFSRALLEAGGVDRLVSITHNRTKYTPRVLKFAGQVLFTMWQHQELREVYRKHGWKEPDFISRGSTGSASGGRAPGSPGGGAPGANSTLSRPMASQGGTRYEDRTIKRTGNQHRHQGDEIPMSDMNYAENAGNPNGRAMQPGMPSSQQTQPGR